MAHRCVAQVAGVATALTLASSTSAIVSRLRSWVETLSIIDWAAGGFGAGLGCLMIVITGMWPGCLVGVVMGLAAGAAYHFGLVVPTQKRCDEPLKQASRFVRDLRMAGADEEALRLFAARYAGAHWQMLCESLFGYDALLQIRSKLRHDPAFTGSTDPVPIRNRVCEILAARAADNRKPAIQRRLAKVERRGLESQGMSAADAEPRSWAMADAIIKSSRVAPDDGLSELSDAKVVAEAKRNRMKAMLAERAAASTDPNAINSPPCDSLWVVPLA